MRYNVQMARKRSEQAATNDWVMFEVSKPFNPYTSVNYLMPGKKDLTKSYGIIDSWDLLY